MVLYLGLGTWQNRGLDCGSASLKWSASATFPLDLSHYLSASNFSPSAFRAPRSALSLARSLANVRSRPACMRTLIGRAKFAKNCLLSSPLPSCCCPWRSLREESFFSRPLANAHSSTPRSPRTASTPLKRNVAGKLRRYTSLGSSFPTTAHIRRERCAFPSSHSAFRAPRSALSLARPLANVRPRPACEQTRTGRAKIAKNCLLSSPLPSCCFPWRPWRSLREEKLISRPLANAHSSTPRSPRTASLLFPPCCFP